MIATDPAFPVSTIDGFTQPGMSLREYFAAAAMQGILANFYRGISANSFESAVKDSVTYADALIEALNLPSSPRVDPKFKVVLEQLLKFAETNTCLHEETHRGGSLWEICDRCDRKWADDEGGMPADAHEWPTAIGDAQDLLQLLNQPHG